MAAMMLAGLQLLADDAEELSSITSACPYRVEAFGGGIGTAGTIVMLVHPLDIAQAMFRRVSQEHPEFVFRLSYQDHILDKTA